jgi:DNA-binding NtrC family response regulator
VGLYSEWSFQLNDQASILIVDDESSQRQAIAGFLKKLKYNVLESGSGEDALAQIMNKPIDLVISDIRMPGMSGLELQNKAREIIPDITFIFMTAFGSVGDAVEAMRKGAYNYLSKPIDLDELEINITKALENRRLVVENRQLKQQLEAKGEHQGLISSSPEMDEVLNLAARVAPTSATVLIQGESGTGKERIARVIHYGSSRANKPLVIVNCAAIPETLLESEMFGHEAGAFTGAHGLRKGKLELANGGTLFIDEIGDMPAGVQPKLLRFLQEGTIERLGSSKSMKLDIRVIAATHRDLEQMVRQGTFREDLYFRLNVIKIMIPPLRERKADIVPLAEHFVKIYARKNSKQAKGFTPRAKDALLKHAYPGNVRELENAIEAAVVLTRSEAIDIGDLPYSFHSNKDLKSFDDDDALPVKLEIIEKRLVMEALNRADGNQSRAARELGISEKNIRDRLKKWGYKG